MCFPKGGEAVAKQNPCALLRVVYSFYQTESSCFPKGGVACTKQHPCVFLRMHGVAFTIQNPRVFLIKGGAKLLPTRALPNKTYCCEELANQIF